MNFSDITIKGIKTNISYEEDMELSQFDEDILGIILKSDKSQYYKANQAHCRPEYTMVLSNIRCNCISWLPIQKTDCVLEVGSDYGQLTGELAQKAGSVAAFDLDLIKTHINTKMNSEFTNISYYAYNSVADFDAQSGTGKYDWIILTEGFSEAVRYFPESEEPQMSMLMWAKSRLTDNGKVVLAVDNKYGLKYLNGSKILGEEFYAASLTKNTSKPEHLYFTDKDLEGYLFDGGFKHFKFFYPYPDHRFMFGMYSDNYLPRSGELSQYYYIWEYGKVNLFDENRVFNTLVEDGKFRDFSNSYMVVASPDAIEKAISDLDYVKYSNDRSESFKIRTEIHKEGDGYVVKKIPLNKYSYKHISDVSENYQKLTKLYSNEIFCFNRCTLNGKAIELEYLEGETLSSKIDEMVLKNDTEGITAEYDKIYNFLLNGAVNFVASRKFKDVFGDFKEPNHIACPISNIDIIPANIIVTKDGKYNVIDYEWTFQFPVPVLYMMYRSILYQFNQFDLCNDSVLKQQLAQMLYDHFNITSEMSAKFMKMEECFQKYLASNRLSIIKYPRIGHINISNSPVQIYMDFGEGYANGEIYNLEKSLSSTGEIDFEINIPDGLETLRIDPCSNKCIVRIISITDDENKILKFKTNGKIIGNSCYLYRTIDPQIIIDNFDKIKSDKIHCHFAIDILSAGIAGSI